MGIRTRPALLLVTVAALTAACERQQSATPTPDQPKQDQTSHASQDPLAALTAEYGEPIRTYTVRGEVKGLPDPERAGTDFYVHHEAIDDFIGQSGDVVGMPSMTMPFPLAEGLEMPAGLKVGDKVSVQFAHWIQPQVYYAAYKIERLPDDTELTFGRATPPPSPESDADAPG